MQQYLVTVIRSPAGTVVNFFIWCAPNEKILHRTSVAPYGYRTMLLQKYYRQWHFTFRNHV